MSRLRELWRSIYIHLMWIYSTVIGKIAVLLFISLFVIVFFSSLAFSHLEHVNLFNSVYWSVITITTVGYGDITPHTLVGKVLAMSVAVSGFAGLTAALSLATNSIINKAMREREGDIRVKGTRVLVIGSSDVCPLIAIQLKKEMGKHGRVVWLTTHDMDSVRVNMARDSGIVVVRGNLVEPSSYDKAGIETASDVVICGRDDREALAIALLLRIVERKLMYLPRVISIVFNDRTERILVQELGVDITVPSRALGHLLLEALKDPTAMMFLSALSEEHPKLIEIEIVRKLGIDYAKIGHRYYMLGKKEIYEVIEVSDIITKKRKKDVFIVAKVVDLDRIAPVSPSDQITVGEKVLAVEFA